MAGGVPLAGKVVKAVSLLPLPLDGGSDAPWGPLIVLPSCQDRRHQTSEWYVQIRRPVFPPAGWRMSCPVKKGKKRQNIIALAGSERRYNRHFQNAESESEWKGNIMHMGPRSLVRALGLSVVAACLLCTVAIAQQGGTWTDPQSGLMWVRRSSSPDVAWEGAMKYCLNLSLGGYSDWRLPSIDELEGFVEDRHLGLSDNNFNYGLTLWSATPNGLGQAWYYVTSYANRARYSVSVDIPNLHALCVRSAGDQGAEAKRQRQQLAEAERQRQEEPRPVWTDTSTGLMWQKRRDDSGSTKFADNQDWDEAVSYCRNLRLGGYSDWRLPTIGELSAIFDRSQPDGGNMKGNIDTGGVWRLWSVTKNSSGEPLSFCFLDGRRLSGPGDNECQGTISATCVRRPGN